MYTNFSQFYSNKTNQPSSKAVTVASKDATIKTPIFTGVNSQDSNNGWFDNPLKSIININLSKTKQAVKTPATNGQISDSSKGQIKTIVAKTGVFVVDDPSAGNIYGPGGVNPKYKQNSDIEYSNMNGAYDNGEQYFKAPDPKLSIKSALAYSSDALKSYDTNKDGNISVDEFNAKLSGNKEGGFYKYGQAIDLNDDGKIDKGEYSAWMIYQDGQKQVYTTQIGGPNSMFGSVDGKVTANESQLAKQQLANDPNAVKAQLQKIYKDFGVEEAQKKPKIPEIIDETKTSGTKKDWDFNSEKSIELFTNLTNSLDRFYTIKDEFMDGRVDDTLGREPRPSDFTKAIAEREKALKAMNDINDPSGGISNMSQMLVNSTDRMYEIKDEMMHERVDKNLGRVPTVGDLTKAINDRKVLYEKLTKKQ